MNSAVHSEDILSSIFQFADNRSQVHCATVCRMWSDVVIPNIWNTVDDINVLFQLFPTTASGKIRILAEDDWKRFNRYARHVRTLSLDDDCYKSGKNADLHPIFQEIAYTHSSGNLLPNLRELRIKPGFYTTLYSALFLHDKLKTIRVKDTRIDIRPILYYAAHKAPNITVLELTSENYPNLEGFYEEFAVASKRLKSLDTLTLRGFSWPSYPRLLSALAFFDRLRSVDYSSGVIVPGNHEREGYVTVEADDEDMVIEDSTAIGNRDVDPTISFAFLESITLTMFGTEFSEMFVLDYQFPNIKKLKIVLCEDVLEESMHTCFCHLALSWKTLRSFVFRVAYASKVINEEYEELHFASMQPLSELVNLECLAIYHPRPLCFSDEGAEIMAKRWSKMLYLKLNPEPKLQDRQPTHLTLSALGSFAAHCKKLKSLALYVDATNTGDLPPVEFRSKTLTNLYFGISPISDNDRDNFNVAMYIYRCCPISCKLSLPLSERAIKRLEAKYHKRLEFSWRLVMTLLQFASSAMKWEHERRSSDCVN